MATYTKAQESKAIDYMIAAKDYIHQLIDLETQAYPTVNDLTDNPETLDKILNYYRVKDMCYCYLLDHQARNVGHYLEELNYDDIEKFFATFDPISIVDFFNQEYIINDFIQSNEFHVPNIFQNDQQFQNDYQNFLKQINNQLPANP